jgi:DNA-binding transcriptional LysR family regulator
MNQGRKRLETDASRQNVKLNVAIESEDPETVKTLVRRNLGVAILPYTSIIADVAKGSFAAMQIENLRHDRYLVQRQDRPTRRAVSELRRIVIATIKRQFRPFAGPNIRLS